MNTIAIVARILGLIVTIFGLFLMVYPEFKDKIRKHIDRCICSLQNKRIEIVLLIRHTPTIINIFSKMIENNMTNLKEIDQLKIEFKTVNDYVDQFAFPFRRYQIIYKNSLNNAHIIYTSDRHFLYDNYIEKQSRMDVKYLKLLFSLNRWFDRPFWKCT